MSRPCRGLVPGSIMACGRLCPRPGRPCRARRIAASPPPPRTCCCASCRGSCAVSWCAAALYRSAVPSYRDPKSPLQPRYKSLYRDPASSSAHYAPCRVCTRPYRGLPLRRVAAQARPCRSIVSRHAQRPSLPPITIQAIVS